ncbi:MAG: hypothetical protein ACYTFX_06435 [Planctomycetota bacterium]|jgi:hypothetical protein
MKNLLAKRSLSNVLLMGLAFCCGCTGLSAETQKKPADYVDPWIESAQSRYFYFNSACRPFGLVNLSGSLMKERLSRPVIISCTWTITTSMWS